MRLGHLVILIGIVCIIVDIIQGNASFSLFIIFPVIYGSGIFFLIGGLLIFIGFILTFFGFAYKFSDQEVESEETGKTEIKKEFGGFVLIGPIPIIFGSNKKMLPYLIFILIIIVILMFLFFV